MECDPRVPAHVLHLLIKVKKSADDSLALDTNPTQVIWGCRRG
jgi:hypothetical protein